MITFLELAHMLNAANGLGRGDDNVPCTCTHVECHARCWVGVGGGDNVRGTCTCTQNVGPF